FSIVGTPTLSAGLTGPALAFNGSTRQNLLSGTNTLAVGASATIDFTVRVVPNGNYGPFTNTANGQTSTVSGSSTTPPFSFPQNPAMTITKTVDQNAIVANANGTFEVPVHLVITNTGNVPLSNVQVTDDLTPTFPAPVTFNVVGTPTLSAGLTAAAPAFDGSANINLLSGND